MKILAPPSRFFRRVSLLGLAPSLLFGCASSSLNSHIDELWQWDGGVEASHVMQALKNQKVLENVPAAVGVTGRGLVGRTLPDGNLWKYDGAVDVLPTLVGDVAIFTGDGKVTMIDLRSGEIRFSVDASGRRLEGAGYNGKQAVLLLVDKDNAREDQIRTVGARGETLASITALARIGSPAAVGNVGLVPYSGQYVAGFDLNTGELIGRVLIRDGLHTVKVDEGNIFMLGAGATLLNSDVTSAPESQSLKLKTREFPGEPVWPIDGSMPRPARSQPVNLLAEPTPKEGQLAFATGAYAATYFEIVVAADQGGDAIRWVTSFNRSIAGADTSTAGPTVCLEDGSIWRLGWEDGTKVPAGSLESRLKTCVVTASTETVATSNRPPLLNQIVETISSTGPDMVAMQRLLLTELARTPSAETTRALLAIAQNPLVSSDLGRRAAQLLAVQTEGGEEMVRALVESAPKATSTKSEAKPPVPPQPPAESPSKEESEKAWEEDAKKELDAAPREPAPKQRSLRPPPVGALAQALLRLKTAGAAAALAPYLSDPSLQASELKDVLATVTALGDDKQIPDVQALLDSYKNTGGEPALLDALVMAASFLFAHLDEAGKAKLRASLDESLTHPDLKARTLGLENQVDQTEGGEPTKASKKSSTNRGKPAKERVTPSAP